jgi:hypothetical protein
MLRDGTLRAMWAKLEQHTNQEHNYVVCGEWINPALSSVKANANDNPTWNKAPWVVKVVKDTGRCVSRSMKHCPNEASEKKSKRNLE